jgi:superfamily II DNA or RNA helicase
MEVDIQVTEYSTNTELIDSDVLTGDITKSGRSALTEKIKSGKVLILIATGQLIGEGFDLPQISTIVFACPLFTIIFVGMFL